MLSKLDSFQRGRVSEELGTGRKLVTVLVRGVDEAFDGELLFLLLLLLLGLFAVRCRVMGRFLRLLGWTRTTAVGLLAPRGRLHDNARVGRCAGQWRGVSTTTDVVLSRRNTSRRSPSGLGFGHDGIECTTAKACPGADARVLLS